MSQHIRAHCAFMSSTPLHSLWSLGIATNNDTLVSELWLIDKPLNARDFIFEALEAEDLDIFKKHIKFQRIGKSPWQKIFHARKVANHIKKETQRAQLEKIFIGNDKRIEFHAAYNSKCDVIGAYLDDGTASYTKVPKGYGQSKTVSTLVGNLYRRILYGSWTPKNKFLGTTSSISEAHLLMPEIAHSVLATKQLHQIKPEWFKHPKVLKICSKACELANLDNEKLQAAKLILCLPNDKLFADHPYILKTFENIALQHIMNGGKVAIKKHPRSEAVKLDIDPSKTVEIPQELPLEILAPLLINTEVIGVVTSSLIYFKALGTGVKTTTIVPNHLQDNPILEIYRKLGINELSV